MVAGEPTDPTTAARRKTAGFLAAIGGLAVLALAVDHWAVRYGAALTAFCVWMWWFVSVGVDRIDALS